MEIYYDDHHDFLEELMALRRETLMETNYDNTTFHSSFPPNSSSSSSYQQDLILPHQIYDDDNFFNQIYDSLLFDEQSPPPLMMDHYSSSSYYSNNTSSNLDSYYPPLSFMEEEELQNLEIETATRCKVEPVVTVTCCDSESPAAIFNADSVMGNKEIRKNSRSTKKVVGQPSKNLMAERRRRKRLNDRLSMLRAIVPKISKMDRTSILGDTIDYMKELLEKINNLQQEAVKVEDSNMAGGIFKDVIKPNEILIRNSPKFAVERGVDNTRVEICCAGKPGMLLSTVNTLEALGLDIQQCVISCFNDFTMHVSCSEEPEQRAMLNSEDIKQALFRSAGYGGRCL
ncbi:hypothetical protein HN51_052879 [Arachis hypogaea]|uniref:transcription factor bHLH93 n=2 Tax=Arachis TaxID=3817 RepID=UPI000DEDD5C9|nr:transcription factor bHLH93 [Arachis hypogaea]QHN94341.1 Transcription factor [Arachis hypogaea]